LRTNRVVVYADQWPSELSGKETLDMFAAGRR